MKVLLLILLLALPAYPQSVDNDAPFDDWQTLGTVANAYGKATVSIAPKTIKRNEDLIRVWLAVTFPEGSFLRAAWQGDPAKMPPVSLIRMSVTFQCDKGTITNDNTFLYDKRGTLIGRYKQRETVREERGTLTWRAFEYFCERGNKPTTAPTLKPK